MLAGEAIDRGLKALHGRGDPYRTRLDRGLPPEPQFSPPPKLSRRVIGRPPPKHSTRKTILQFWPDEMKPHQIVEFNNSPQVGFIGQRLLLDPAQAPHLRIEQVVVGRNCQGICAVPMPGWYFSGALTREEYQQALIDCVVTEISDVGKLDFDPAYPGVAITITISNQGPTPLIVSPVILGVALRHC